MVNTLKFSSRWRGLDKQHLKHELYVTAEDNETCIEVYDFLQAVEWEALKVDRDSPFLILRNDGVHMEVHPNGFVKWADAEECIDKLSTLFTNVNFRLESYVNPQKGYYATQYENGVGYSIKIGKV